MLPLWNILTLRRLIGGTRVKTPPPEKPVILQNTENFDTLRGNNRGEHNLRLHCFVPNLRHFALILKRLRAWPEFPPVTGAKN